MIQFTKAGWLYLAITLFLGISAVNTGNNLIYLIEAAFLSFLIVSGILGKRNLAHIEVALKIPDEIYATMEFPLQVTLVNHRSFLPAFLLRVNMGKTRVLFPFTAGNGTSSQFVKMRFDRRGVQNITDVYIGSIFPFNFFVRNKLIKKTHDCIVFPRPAKCEEWRIFEKEYRHIGEKPLNRKGDDSDIMSFRDYVVGDPLKYIDWKASARSGKLKTKELASLSFQPFVIDFSKIQIKHIELKLSCLTYVILSLIRKNIPVGLKMGEVLHKPTVSRGHKVRMLRELALYGNETFDDKG